MAHMKRLLYPLLLSAAVLIAADVKLPAPYHTPTVSNAAKVVPQPSGSRLNVPAGFTVEEFAANFQKPRVLLGLPNGSVLVSDSVPKGAVYVLDDKDRDGKSESRRAVVEGLDRPYGLAVYKNYLYIAEPTSLKRYKFDTKAVKAEAGEEIIKFPADFAKGHWTRSITFHADKLYLNVGSGSNVDPDTDERRATILECKPDGTDCQIFAAGLRNATGIHFRPGSNELWATIQERDGLGDDLVPDFFARIQRGGFYGWPWAYFGPNEEPRHAGKRPEMVKKTITPDVSLGAHVAVMDWTFYTGKQFPQKYRGGAFIALRGSSNRSKRVGYSIVYLPFGKDGKAASQYEDFLTGFMLSPDSREVWGRPVGVAQLADGSLLLSEDGANKLYRVSYKK
jgi:glucose/arabinose dehydrogenase